MTVVERLRETGIRRLGGMKSGFRYRYAEGGKPGRKVVERIRELKVPPAWREVAIARSPRAAIQAVGRDVAGRWQYLYHQRAVARREEKKYRRLIAFTRALPALRKQVATDLARGGIGREKVLAAMLRIVSLCFLRPGSDKYASENGSYGIATLRRNHVQVRGSRVQFRFTGKSGQAQESELDDRRVAAVVRALLRQPGRRLFRFRDEDGDLVDVRRGHINAYIKEVMGARFSAKDFRTWAGTMICASALSRAGFDEDDSPAQLRAKIAAAVKETAVALGNTPAVCRSSYITPDLVRSYEAGRVLSHPPTSLAKLACSRSGRLQKCERALLRLLEDARPGSK
jgi:DNA topoisomerase-1